MSKSKSSKPKASLQGVVDALVAFEGSLELGASLAKDERSKLRKQSDQVSDAFIELVANLATQQGGLVAGVAFDVDAAQKVIARSRDARAAADVCRRLAQRMEDDAVPQRIVVGKRAFAVYAALRRLVSTPEGNPLMHAFENLASLARRSRASGRAKVPPPSPAPEPKPAVNGAPAAIVGVVGTNVSPPHA